MELVLAIVEAYTLPQRVLLCAVASLRRLLPPCCEGVFWDPLARDWNVRNGHSCDGQAAVFSAETVPRVLPGSAVLSAYLASPQSETVILCRVMDFALCVPAIGLYPHARD